MPSDRSEAGETGTYRRIARVAAQVAIVLVVMGLLTKFVLPHMGNTVECAGDCPPPGELLPLVYFRTAVILVVLAAIGVAIYQTHRGDPNAE